VRFERERVVMLGKDARAVSISEEDDATVVAFADGERVAVSSGWVPGEPVWTGTVGAHLVAVQVRPIMNGVRLTHAGRAADVRVYTRREAELVALMPEKADAGAGKALLCPMPGLVKSIPVKAGQEVKAGEALAVVEAMKMENVLRAERDATIAKVLAKEGDSLAVDAVILEFA
jgi:propionyl-CoA carboxylase alpha chain